MLRRETADAVSLFWWALHRWRVLYAASHSFANALQTADGGLTRLRCNGVSAADGAAKEPKMIAVAQFFMVEVAALASLLALYRMAGR